MNGLKTILVAALGLGVTWVAWEIAPADTSAMIGNVVYAQEPEESGSENTVSSEELEEQLARIEAAMQIEGEVREFKPSEPLPADIAIDMSSEL